MLLLLGLSFTVTLTLGTRVPILHAEHSKTEGAEIAHGNDTSAQQCADYWLGKLPYLGEHFSRQLIEHHCHHESKWLNIAEHTFDKEDSELSVEQTNWLTGIWECKDLTCICKGVPLCKKFVDELANNFDVSGKRVKRDSEIIENVVRGVMGKAKRKEIRMMTSEERATYFSAVNKLKEQQVGDKKKYDILFYYHTPDYAPGAHFCAAFLPFHREMVKTFEVALRQIEPAVGSAYYDAAMDARLPDPRDSVIWSDEFIGNGEGVVNTGPYSHWKTVPDKHAAHLNKSTSIKRSLGNDTELGKLFTEFDEETMMNKTAFRQMSHCVDPFFEFAHARTHIWIGGHMGEITASPNDPFFFLFHTYVDYLWEAWRLARQDRVQRETDYPTDNETCRESCRATAQMKPFNLTNIDGLSNVYTDKLYSYDTKPTCNRETKNCGSPYLFCHSESIKCIGKVKINGNCSGFESEDICYKSKCVEGRCLAIDAQNSTTTIVDPPPEVSAPKLFPVENGNELTKQ